MQKLMTCTCGNRIVQGQIERPHAESCECSWAPMRPVKEKPGPRATPKQLAFLERLGIDVVDDLTVGAANSQIKLALSKRKKNRKARR